MAELAPLAALVKKIPEAAHKPTSLWIHAKAHADDPTEGPVFPETSLNGMPLDEIASALIRKAPPRILFQLMAQAIMPRFPEEAFCLLAPQEGGPKRVLIKDGLHAELYNALISDHARLLFPFLFDGSNGFPPDTTHIALCPVALDILEMIQRIWHWSHPKPEGVVFAVFGAETCAPTVEQLNFGKAVAELGDLIFCKATRDRLSDEIAAESQGKQISAGHALLLQLKRASHNRA